jgi:hypothetical protein
MIVSPYEGKSENQWKAITEQLIQEHPLDTQEIVNAVLNSWNNIFSSSIGKHKFRFGTDIFPKPQIMGFLLHELIPLEIEATYPGEWRGEKTASDKDIECITNDRYSIELKTSSNRSQIFGNRSYAQKPTEGKKGKDGFYLAVNFEKFDKSIPNPKIVLIRFGWLDHSDWIGQTAATGQQARLASETYDNKFQILYAKR